MKIFGIEIHRTREKQAGANIYGVQRFETQYGLLDAIGNKSKTLSTYASWVYACATKRAQSVAAAKFRLYKRNGADDYTELDDHNSLLILERPNPLETKYQYLFRTVLHMDLTGDAYSLIVRDKANRIRELWSLQPETIRIIPNQDGTIAYYELKNWGEGKTTPILPKDVIHFKHPNPTNPYYGASVVMAAAQSVDINSFQHNYQRNFYKQSALPPAVLESDSKLNDDVIKRLRENFDSVYGGAENAGKTIILEGGLKYKQLGISPKELDWLATNKFTLTEICAIFGVPPAMLGIVEDVNRANAESQEYTYAKMTVEPMLRNIDEQLTLNLVRQYPDGAGLFIQHDSTVPEDEQRQATASKERIFSGVTTINEERKLHGYEGIGENGDKHFMPVNYSPIDNIINGNVDTNKPQEDKNGQNL